MPIQYIIHYPFFIIALIIRINKYESLNIKPVGSFRDGEATRATMLDSIKAFSLNNEVEDGDLLDRKARRLVRPKDWEVERSGKIELLSIGKWQSKARNTGGFTFATCNREG